MRDYKCLEEDEEIGYLAICMTVCNFAPFNARLSLRTV